MKKQILLTAALMLMGIAAMANCSNGRRIGMTAEQTASDTAAAGKEMAPDFTLTDIEGKSFQLSSLRGKIVVIDFWGSWCGWCIKGMPEMKNYYNKYKGKLEIVGVDCRDTDAQWKSAVKQLDLPWIHVYNPKGIGDITGIYAIQGFPTKCIVGKDGQLLKVVIGEDPAFYTALDEIMKN